MHPFRAALGLGWIAATLGGGEVLSAPPEHTLPLNRATNLSTAQAGPVTAPCEFQKLTASDAAPLHEFGISVSLSGDRAIVGAPGDNCLGVRYTFCGSAYVYRSDGTTWVQEQKLTASDSELGDRFGIDVSLSSDRAIVGASGDDCPAGSNCGSAYVYRYNGTTWVEEQKLTASDAAPEDLFGGSVSLSGDKAIVGAALHDCPPAIDCGAAYVYRYNGTTWVQEQKLTAFDAAPGDGFGVSVSLSGDRAIVGASGDDCPAGSNCGSAYVYRYDGTTWVQEHKLTASDARSGAGFGSSVALSGHKVIVGAMHDRCPAGFDCGSAYVYRHDGTTWAQEQKLTAPDAAQEDRFGGSVSLSRERAIVGAIFGECRAGSECGSAYVYHYDGTTWVLAQRLTASDADQYDNFGVSVSLSGDTAIAGARLNSCAAELWCGSAYVFALGPDCQGNGVADACDIRDHGVPDEDHNDIPDECEPVTAGLDIRPGGCPNPLNLRSRGVLTAAIVGGPGLDVADIDVSSLFLERSDGIGGSVRPLAGLPGPGTTIEDAATPLSGTTCECHELAGDGIDDLLLKFSTQELVESLELSPLAAGTSVPLKITGALHNGRPLEASDCIVITGASKP